MCTGSGVCSAILLRIKKKNSVLYNLTDSIDTEMRRRKKKKTSKKNVNTAQRVRVSLPRSYGVAGPAYSPQIGGRSAF